MYHCKCLYIYSCTDTDNLNSCGLIFYILFAFGFLKKLFSLAFAFAPVALWMRVVCFLAIGNTHILFLLL